MIYQLLRQGKLFFVGGGWGMPDEATTSYHGIIDQFTYSLRKLNATFLDCGRPLVAWQADTFGHSREMAALLANMGFDGVFINPISFDDELTRMADRSLEFLWRGSDDLGQETDIFSHKLFDGYWTPPGFCFSSMCGDPILITSDSAFNNVDERANLFLESVLHRQAPHYTTQNIMVMMGHRFGYHDAALWFTNVDKLINAVNMKSNEGGRGVHVFYSTPACYLKAVHYSKPVLQTKQDDFFPFAYDKHTYATGLYTSRPTIKYMVREGHIYLQMSKQLQVLARLGNNDKFFEEMNWIMGILQDHNVITGAMRSNVKNYYTFKIYDAVQSATVLLRKAFNKVRNSTTRFYHRCSFNISSCQNFARRKSFVVIYNPLGWPVTIPVRLPVTKEKYVIYDPKGEIVQSVMMKIPSPVLSIPERNTAADHELVFIAKDLPPLGLRSYFLEKITPRVKKSLIKKLKKNKKTKYYIRQANPYTIDNKTFFVDEYYDYYEDITTQRSKIQIGNVPKLNERNDDDVQTPKPRKVLPIEDFTVKPTESVYGFFTDRKIVTDLPTRTTTDDTEATLDETTTSPITTTKVYVSTTDVSNDEHTTESMKVDDFRKYAHLNEESNDLFIENKYIKISLDESTRKVASILLSNGVNTSLDIQFYFYASDDPKQMKTEKKPPGAYIFRAMDAKPEPIINYVHTKVYKTDIVSEIHCKYSDYASFVVKLYEDSPVVEVDWVAGPIPIDDDIGKDVFIRYTSDLVNDGVFYTDANGRQTMKRIRNRRASYQPIDFDPIAGNIYPVTSRIYIEDRIKNIRLSIFNDRSQGGTSLQDGTIDLFVHRRILTDDNGVQTYLNETVEGKGIIVRGKHYIYLSKADYKPNRVFQKKFAKEIELMPQVFADGNNPKVTPEKEKWLEYNNEVLALRKKLPIGIHLMTIEQWNGGTLLIRLENYLEKIDVVKHGTKKVFLKDLFLNIRINKVKETTLAGNIWLENWTPLQWNKSSEFVRNFNDFYGNEDIVEYSRDEGIKPVEDVVLDEGITLSPQQIRTFVAWYRYNDKDSK
ncbi:lysosomal alpha-mannosidase-like [Epargyreus clarus]|uniref:lysosomal alpha-mannosidase-like n=1 Tax=Epargyreus clarus TaxID=520877 RepID=UPI003C2AD61E